MGFLTISEGKMVHRVILEKILVHGIFLVHRVNKNNKNRKDI